MKLQFAIQGKPQGKGRARFAKVGNFVRTYTPDQTVSYENWVKTCFMQRYPNFKPLETPLMINLKAYFLKAKSNKMPDPMIKPDADNILKIIADSLNGIAYKDDKQIVAVTVNKLWGEIETVVVEIEEL